MVGWLLEVCWRSLVIGWLLERSGLDVGESPNREDSNTPDDTVGTIPVTMRTSGMSI